MRLYSVFDSIAEKFGPIFEMDNDATAKRAFINAIKNNINRQDFQLFCIGSWNNEEGKITVFNGGNKFIYQMDNKIKEDIGEEVNESAV